jgi:hypothetical protein
MKVCLFVLCALSLSSLFTCCFRQEDPVFRQVLLRYHLPTLIQLGIFAYVATAWGYLSKVNIKNINIPILFFS